MSPFRCGCLVEAVAPDDYCDADRLKGCHNPGGPAGECRPCWRRRMLGVNLDPGIIHLARQRVRDRNPDLDPGVARLAEPGEFPSYLTADSKVRS